MGVADRSAISMRVGSDFVSAPMEENLMMTSSGKLEGGIEKTCGLGEKKATYRRPRFALFEGDPLHPGATVVVPLIWPTSAMVAVTLQLSRYERHAQSAWHQVKRNAVSSRG
jgi:hypothetical protein